MSIPFEPLRIIRDAATKKACLAVDASVGVKTDFWRLYEQKTPGTAKILVLEGHGPGTFPLPEAYTTWTRFLFAGAGTLTPLAERHLPMVGGYNFRDLGGLPGVDGKRIAWGKLFRSDDLKHLTREDQEYLASIPVKTVVDFRAPKEAAAAPDRLPAPETRYLHCPILPGTINTDKVTAGRIAMGEAFMTNLYSQLVSDAHIIATYALFFRQIQNLKELPLLFHCSAGKDRTGVAAALILLALGVDKQTVFADYVASNAYLADKYADDIKANPIWIAIYTVRPTYLEAAIAEMEKSHGTVPAYLEQVLDVDIPALRACFLE